MITIIHTPSTNSITIMVKEHIIFLFACMLFISCQQDVSGTYKSIKTSETLGSDEIYIDWEGRTFERSLYGHANELYTDESKRPHRHARIEYDYRGFVKGKLERHGEKYVGSDFEVGIEIDKEKFKISNAFLEPLPNKSKDELIDYVKEAFNNGIKQQYKDGISVEFVIKGNKLIFVGGNEVNDYFIKLVE